VFPLEKIRHRGSSGRVVKLFIQEVCAVAVAQPESF